MTAAEIQNMPCADTPACTSSPDTSRPAPAPMPVSALSSAMLEGTRSGGKIDRTIPMASGIAAKPMPCRARPASTTPIDVETATSTEPSVVSASVAMRTRLRPSLSPSEPSSGVNTAADSMLTVTTQETSAIETSSDCARPDRIGMTMLCMTTIANVDSASTSSTAVGCDSARRARRAGAGAVRVSDTGTSMR